MDINDKRKIAKNWREYLAETGESLKVFRWVWRDLIDPASRRLARLMLALSVASSVFAMAQPWLVKWIFDGVIARDQRLIVLGLAGFLACLLMRQLFHFLTQYCREYMFGANHVRIDERLSELFFAKSLGQHLRDNSTLSVGNMEKGRGRVMHIQEMVIFNWLSVLLNLALAFVFLWYLSLLVGFAATLLTVNYFVWTVFLNRRCLELCVPVDAEFRKHNRYRVERWDKIERVKTCGKEREETERIAGWLREIFVRDRGFWLWFIRMINLRSLIDVAVLALIMVYGVWRAWEGVWTVGLLYPLFSWSRAFTDNLGVVSQMEHQLNAAMPSIKSMMEALTAPSDIVDRPDAIDLPASGFSVEFRGVDHTYVATGLDEDAASSAAAVASGRIKKAVLNDVSFAVGPGEKVALIGSSGAGKTTIMRLLQRYMDPEQGSILVGGRDLRDYRLGSWTAALGYIAQQPQVLDGTIRSNLLYGLDPGEREKATDADLWNLIRRLKIDFGDRLTEGLETRVGRNGLKLSGGEAQRLMIGAAAMRRPRFMIIDEATSSLDSSTEKEVQRGLAEVLAGDMSALVIAHRLSTVRNLCTKFLVLRSSGETAESGPQIEASAGSFEELYRLSPTFRRLADDQGLKL
ncbi:MAG: ABC transporter ATP-binding protein [Patescibacteria group bacterium]|jgi:ABC-type multidrug transport system fused ATPase/permease subunit